MKVLFTLVTEQTNISTKSRCVRIPLTTRNTISVQEGKPMLSKTTRSAIHMVGVVTPLKILLILPLACLLLGGSQGAKRFAEDYRFV